MATLEISFEEVRRLVDRVATAVLERYRLLPYAEEDGLLLFATDQSWTPLAVDELTLRLGRRFRLNQVPASASFDRVLFAVSKGVSLGDLSGEMEIGCDPRFQLKCPLDWFELEKTEDALARHCRVCAETVYFATTESERRARLERGHCVAFREVSQNSDSAISMGYVVDVSGDDLP